MLKDSLYTIPVQNGNFYALPDLDNIFSVPHNILIDKQGNIFEYNAARPDTYIKNNNSIDELIKE